MSSVPAVSVILPVYNGQKYLASAIKSILEQTMDDFELLVLDDGSSDSSADIADAMDDQRIHVHRRPHEGLISTLNFGLAAARGEWLARMDADDVALPTRFQRQLEFLATHPDIVALGTAARIIDAADQDTGAVSTPPERHEDLINLIEYKARGAALIHPSVMMKRQAALDCGGYRSQFPVAEDKDMWLRMAQKGQLHSLSEPLLLLRKHDANVSFTGQQKQLESALAALVCELVRRQTGRDMVSDCPERWQSCVSRIHELADRQALVKAKDDYREFTVRVRKGFPVTILSALMWALTHPNVVKGRQVHKHLFNLANTVTREMVAEIERD